MNKVITINLNGRAYQLEEDGYQILQDYLKAAEEKLNNDPDKTEIMNDLEQALSEKLERFLRPGKNVIIKQEAETAIKEMGPVEGEGASASANQQSAGQQTHKRLYRIPEGEMVGGVCTGLAAYFDLDVNLVRLIFVVLTILTHVAWIIIYIVLWLALPTAQTDKQRAAAYGVPFTAQEWINRARTEYQKFADKGEWKKWKEELKQQHKLHKREIKQQYRQMRWQNHSPFLGILSVIISVLWVFGLISLISKGIIYGFIIPTSIPLWISILGWIVIYGLIISPLKALRWMNYNNNHNNNYNGYHHHNDGFLEGIAWTAIIVIVFWAVYTYVPDSRHYFQNIVTWLGHIWGKIRR